MNENSSRIQTPWILLEFFALLFKCSQLNAAGILVFGSDQAELLIDYPALTLAMVEYCHSQALTQAWKVQQYNLKHRRSAHHMINPNCCHSGYVLCPNVFFQAALSYLSSHRPDVCHWAAAWWQSQAHQRPTGMDKHVFLKFVRKLFTMTSANHSRHVDLAENVAIFLYTMVTNLSNRKVGECFQRWWYNLKYEFPLSSCFPWLISVCLSDASIKSWMLSHPQHSTRLTLNSPPNLPSGSIYLPTIWNYSHSQRCIWSTGWHSYFQHAPLLLMIPLLQPQRRGLTKFLSHYIWHALLLHPQWMGGKCLRWGCLFMMHVFMTWRSQGGKYYLADAGYPICDALLVQFCGVWYHLWEWETSGWGMSWSWLPHRL